MPSTQSTARDVVERYLVLLRPDDPVGGAQALAEAERSAAAEQGREQRRRFLTPGVGYQPGNAQMFPGSN